MKTLLSIVLLLFVQEDAYKQGKAQLDQKQYDAAEESFRQLIDEDAPTASNGYAGLAEVEIGRKSYDQALEYAKKAVELNGENADAHYVLGLVYAFRQDFKGAASALERALALNPNNAYGHYQLGLVQYQLKRMDHTVIHFEKFIQMMPNAPEAPQVRSILKTVKR
jgi:tetratricopeptide (TPR) repeat protein